MSDKAMARRAAFDVSFGGVNITSSIRRYLLSMTYTDNEEDAADDLQIKLQDRDGLWTKKWLLSAVDAAAAEGLRISATLVRRNWRGDGRDDVLDCGAFELDDVRSSGPPATVTIKATSLPFSAQIRQTKKTKAWEAYALSGIANEMAGGAGMGCMFLCAVDPFYARVEQFEMSDIDFLKTLCHDAGASLKATNGLLVIFDQADYESKASVVTIKKGGGKYKKYDLRVGTADAQYTSCRVSYVSPTNGRVIEGVARVEDYKAGGKNNQQLEIAAKVTNAAEAKALAEKHLRLHNKYEKTAAFTMPGDPALVAGVTFDAAGFGGWDGRYIVKQAVHSISGSGYATKIVGRRVLEGY